MGFALARAGVEPRDVDLFVQRISEYAADRFAMQCGFGPQLLEALSNIDSGTGRANRTQRASSRHPSISRRVEAMQRHALRAVLVSVAGPAWVAAAGGPRRRCRC